MTFSGAAGIGIISASNSEGGRPNVTFSQLAGCPKSQKPYGPELYREPTPTRLRWPTVVDRVDPARHADAQATV